MTPLFNFPPNFVASTTEFMGQLISSVSGITTLIIGVLLTAVVLEIIIGILRK